MNLGARSELGKQVRIRGTVFCALLLLAVSLGRANEGRADNAAGAAASGISSKHLVILYRKETANAPNRLDPAVQAVTLAIEQEFLKRQYQIIEPSPDTYRAMDQVRA